MAAPTMRAVFADEVMVARWLDAEAALARAQGRPGADPAGRPPTSSAAAPASANLDLDSLRRGVESSGHPLVPAIRALERLAGEAGKYVHWGATTQDIIDTGFVLQLKDGAGDHRARARSADRLARRAGAGLQATRRWRGALTASMPCR
jgi:3-carboxy-cis,cis-muconate cycloisomerase